jgi:hypothetical protein
MDHFLNLLSESFDSCSAALWIGRFNDCGFASFSKAPLADVRLKLLLRHVCERFFFFVGLVRNDLLFFASTGSVSLAVS